MHRLETGKKHISSSYGASWEYGIVTDDVSNANVLLTFLNLGNIMDIQRIC